MTYAVNFETTPRTIAVKLSTGGMMHASFGSVQADAITNRHTVTAMARARFAPRFIRCCILFLLILFFYFIMPVFFCQARDALLLAY